MSLISDMTDDINRQRRDYVQARLADPDRYGHTDDGCMDGTPETGPAPLPVMWGDHGDYHFRNLWCVHKWPWPFEYWYCFGEAKDSRGERTDEALMLDVRTLPKAYIGRYQVARATKCCRRAHKIVIGRALADGYDLAAHAAREIERYKEEAHRRATPPADEVPF